MIKVTIIVPVYNAEKNLNQCIDSIINQTYKNIELILINDGSKDKSLDIISDYEKKYDFINVIDKENEGVAVTRNLGIKKASGDYIMFVDNDDYLDYDYVEKYVYELKSNDYDVIIGGFNRVDLEGKELYRMKLKNTNWAKYIIITPWAKLFKKDYLINNKIEFFSYPIGEDVYFNLLLQSKNPLTKIISYCGYNWLNNEKSVSNTTHKGLSKDIDILKLLFKINELNTRHSYYLTYYIKKFYIWYLLYSGKHSSVDDFCQEHKRVYEWYKLNIKKKPISSLSYKLKGESLKNRLIVFVFDKIEKFKLVKIFAQIYCKGE